MATINFSTTANAFTIAVDSHPIGTWSKTRQVDDIYDLDITDSVIILSLRNSRLGSGYYTTHLYATDTIQIDDVTQTGTLYDIADSLKEVLYTDAAAVSGQASYTKYVALLSQGGSGAPVATVLENTIGEIVWTRTGTGQYDATLAGAFPGTKTLVFINQDNYNELGLTYGTRTSEDVVNVNTRNPSGTSIDDKLTSTPIEIRVYE